MAIVSYTLENAPELDKEYLDSVAAIKDEDIDCSDIPELKDMKGLVPRHPGKMFKPLKTTITCKLDADVVAWLKSDGKGYQTRLNAILRHVMASAPKRERQAATQSH
jgi:uncharacterized protein (DUF4415 family)